MFFFLSFLFLSWKKFYVYQNIQMQLVKIKRIEPGELSNISKPETDIYIVVETQLIPVLEWYPSVDILFVVL